MGPEIVLRSSLDYMLAFIIYMLGFCYMLYSLTSYSVRLILFQLYHARCVRPAHECAPTRD